MSGSGDGENPGQVIHLEPADPDLPVALREHAAALDRLTAALNTHSVLEQVMSRLAALEAKIGTT